MKQPYVFLTSMLFLVMNNAHAETLCQKIANSTERNECMVQEFLSRFDRASDIASHDKFSQDMKERWAIQDSIAKEFNLVGRTGIDSITLLNNHSYSCEFSVLSGLGLDPKTNMPIGADLPTVHCSKNQNIPVACKSLRVIISLPPQITPKTEAEYHKALEDFTLTKESLIYDCSIPN